MAGTVICPQSAINSEVKALALAADGQKSGNSTDRLRAEQAARFAGKGTRLRNRII